MSGRLYQFYCEICNWKKITDGADVKDMIEIKTSPIPGGVPKRDVVTNEVIRPPAMNQLRKFKCPKCGRIIIPKKIDDPQQTENEKRDFEERAKQSHEKDWADGRKGSS